MRAGYGSLQLSDGQISIYFKMESLGVGIFLKSLIRVLASAETRDEMAHF